MTDFISSFRDWVIEGRGAPLTDAPEKYLKYIAYWTLSTMAKRNFYLEYGARKLYPNIWISLIGKSSFYRKSTAIALGARLILQIDPRAIYPNEFSLEQLLEVLTYRPQGSFVVDEFSTFYGQFGRSYMGGSSGLSLITELYDRFLPYERSLKEITYRVENPFINFISATTLISLEHTIKPVDIRGGFLPRFVFVVARKKERDVEIPGESDSEKESELIRFLRKIEKMSKKLHLSSLAEIEYKKFYAEIKSHYAADLRNGISPFITRLLTCCLKFAMLNHISQISGGEASADIDKEAMVKATTMTGDLIKEVRKLFTEMAITPFQARRRRVIESIRKFGDDWVTRSKLLRDVKMSAPELNMVLETLIQEDSILVDSEQSPLSKKSTTKYKLGPDLLE